MTPHVSRRPTFFATTAVVVCLAALFASGFGAQQAQEGGVRPDGLWIVPAQRGSNGTPTLADAVSLLDAKKPADAIAALSSMSLPPALAGYGLLYEARAHLALEKYDEARRAAERLLAAAPAGALAHSAARLAAEVAERSERWADAVLVLDRLTAAGSSAGSEIVLRLARAAEKAGQPDRAREAFLRLYFDYPASPEATDAEKSLTGVGLAPTAADWARSLERADRLFAGRRWAEAQKAYLAVRDFVSAADARARVDLRLAQGDFHQRRYAAARDAAVKLAAPEASAEIARDARFVAMAALRELKREAEYLRELESFVGAYPQDPLAETALNEHGTYYIQANEDAKAAEVFRDLYRRYPTGAFADRAAWKAGWWSYKSGEYAETIRIFSTAAVGLRRADYRPSWLYWTGRSHAKLGARDEAAAAYRQTIADYRNSYYGRQAARELEALLAATRPTGAGPVTPASRVLPPTIDPGPAPANADLVQHLLAAGLHADAVLELQAARRDAGSTWPRLEATLAYALNRSGQLRPGISAMRRAYPQFMAAGGEALPEDILRVIFPVDHWSLIRRQAAAHELDPYLMAALIAQESTFQADVRSSANAWGLMQVIPATGRRYASRLGIRPFSTGRLTDPEVNVWIGMTYFTELLRRFGDPAPALAAYNAGENRVARWLAERPGIDRDEFIDDIPFPETQNYVKRVLGTAEDYRLLYGGAASADPRP